MTDPSQTLVEQEIADLQADRTRITEARARNPHLDHWKTPGQLGAIDRDIRRLQQISEEETRV